MSALKPGWVALYRGQPVDTLTREEMIEAYTHVVAELQEMREHAAQDVEMFQLFEDTRKRLHRR